MPLVVKRAGAPVIVLAEEVRRARTFTERVRGAIGHDLPENIALVFERAPQVHTFGMRHPLDVVFCDANLEVMKVIRNLRPNRVSPWVRRSRVTIEMRGGVFPADVGEGETLALIE